MKRHVLNHVNKRPAPIFPHLQKGGVNSLSGRMGLSPGIFLTGTGILA
jgi:hypothetical protein